LEGGAEVDILDGGDGNDQLKGGAGVDVYQLHSNYGSDVITDSDGQGIVLINDVALNSGTYQFQDIYKNTPTNTLVTKVNGGNTLIISQVEPTNSTPNRIIINNWSETNNLNISLTGSAPTPTGNVMNGDFKKDIETNGTPDTADDTYKISTVNGISNYQYGVAEANAKDLMNGTAGNDVMDGKSGDDYLNGKDGNDYIQGGVGGDYIQGGMGKDTLNGGAGDDYIYGSSDMDIDMPNDVNFTKPVNEWSHPQATGFNWTTGYDNGDVYSNGTPDGYTRPTPRNRLADDQSSFIDGGAGNDFIAAGTGADYVHGGADMDVIYGMDKDDILFGDGGNDVIFGDGDENTNGYSVVWTTANNHGNDIVDGGDGDDILYGQGGNDIIFGGNNNDKIWGDGGSDLNVFGGNFGDDYIVGGRGNDELHGGEGNDIIYGDDPSTNEVGDDVIYGGKGADTLIGGGGFDTYHVDKNDTIIDIANVSSASTGKVLFDGLKLTGGYRTPNKTDYTNGAGIFYNLTGTVLQVYGARGNLTINNFANHDLGIHLEEVNTPPAPPTPDVLGSGAVSNLADAAITSTTLNNLLTQFTVGERTEQVAMITQLVDAWADTGGMAESYDDRINGMGVSYPTTMQEFVPYVARYMAFGTVVRTYVPDRNPLGYLEAEARRDLNNSDLTSSFRQLIAAWNQKIHILESFSGKYFLGLPAQQPEPNFNIVANTGGGGNNTISYVLDYPIGISYEQAQLDQYQKDYDSIVSSTYQSLLLQTRFKPVLNLLDFVGDNHQLDFTRVNAYFDGLLLQDATVGVLELIDFNFATDAMFKDTAWQGWVRLGGLLDNVTLTPEVLSAIKLNGGAIVAETFENIGTPEHDHVKFYDELSNNIYGSDNEDVLFGLAGNDNIFGSAGSDILLGGAGEDNLNGGEGNDTLMGGTGNDSMDGGNGSDTFVVGIGDGADIISDYGYTGDPAIDSAAIDVVQLGIKSTDITALLRVGENLVIQSGTGDQLTIAYQMNQTYHDYYGYGVEQLQFSDGVTWTQADITARAVTIGNALDDSITGLDGTTNRINGFDGNDYLSGGNQEDAIDGGLGNDTLIGNAGNDSLLGGEGDDILNGGEGNDTLVGGTGNDNIEGGIGNDTFVIGVGAGADTISDYGYTGDPAIDSATVDVVQLAIKSTDITALLRVGDDLVIQSGAGDQLTIKYQLSAYHDYYGYGVEQLQFSDGVTWTHADITARAVTIGNALDDSITGLDGTTNRINGFDGNDYFSGGDQADTIDGGLGNDNIFGNAGSDILLGGAGEDNLHGGEGNDALMGGTGNDSMDGGNGSDTFVVGIGDGADIISDYGYTGDPAIDSATVDVLQLAIKSTDITALLRDGDNLVIQSGTGDQVTIIFQLSDYHDYYGYGVEQLQFSDGVTWTHADILARVMTYGTTADDNISGLSNAGNRINGFDGNDLLTGGNVEDMLDGGSGDDTLSGREGDDTLVGGVGNDVMDGGNGNDTFVIGAGAGIDTVSDYGADTDTDVVQLAIKSTDITAFLRDGENLIIQSGTSDQLTIAYQLSTYHDYYGYGVEQLQFSDGVTWTQADILSRVITNGSMADDNISGLSNAGNRINGFDGNDYLYGGNQADVIDGGTGDDTLNGGEGNDTLVGGVGNDVMDGGSGSDTYVIGIGDGVDTITDTGYTGDAIIDSATVDVVQLAIKSTDITALLRVGDDLVIQSGAGDQLTITYQLGYYHDAYGYGIEQLQFSDGVTWTQADIIANVATYGTTGDDNLGGMSSSNNRMYGLEGNDYLYGGNLNDIIDGGAGDDTLNGYEGNDILIGGAGNDALNDSVGSNLFDGGAGDDVIYASTWNELLIGGKGFDTITTSTGYDVISFNKGDGQDIVESSTGADDTISLGGEFAYSDLSLNKSDNNLIIKLGATDQITLKHWYADSSYRSVVNLQVIAEEVTGFTLGGADTLRNNKVETFNFANLVSQFDADVETNAANASNWQLTDARLTAHLQSGSDTAAIGGDLAYQYGRNGNLTGVGLLAAQNVINATSFGQTAQTLNNPSVWSAEVVKLG